MRYKHLHGWYITYNEYTDKFCAAKSEHKEQLASGSKGDTICSSSILTLLEIIERTQGNKEKLDKLIK